MAPDWKRTLPRVARRGPRARGAVVVAALLAGCAEEPNDRGERESLEPNVLEARTRVADMAERTVNALKGELALEDVEGWAVFSGDVMVEELEPGLGKAEDRTGESYFMRTGGEGCVIPGSRQLLVFGDPRLFRQFRQGDLQGEALARAAGDGSGAVAAYRVQMREPPRLDPADPSPCRYELQVELQRALVAEPSATEEMIEEEEVYEDDN